MQRYANNPRKQRSNNFFNKKVVKESSSRESQMSDYSVDKILDFKNMFFQIIYPGEQERQLNTMYLLYFDCYINIVFKLLFHLIC